MFRNQDDTGGKYSSGCLRPKICVGWQECVEQREMKRRHTEARLRVVICIIKYQTQLAKTSFEETLDLTAEIFFLFRKLSKPVRNSTRN